MPLRLIEMVAFSALGVRPTRWWEAERARRATRRAALFWSLSLLALVAVTVVRWIQSAAA